MQQYNRKIKKQLWHDWQLKVIADNAGILPANEIAEKIGRSEVATRKKANLHGFSLVINGGVG